MSKLIIALSLVDPPELEYHPAWTTIQSWGCSDRSLPKGLPNLLLFEVLLHSKPSSELSGTLKQHRLPIVKLFLGK